MVSRLIAFAKDEGIVEQLLRKENNRKETALHEAVRLGDDELVTELLRADGALACFPEEGTSPLYLAISLGRVKTAETLLTSDEDISCGGPDGQNALHAAVLRGPKLTRMVLEWNTNKNVTTKRDISGRTPLHFAASLAKGRPLGQRRAVFPQVLEANLAAIYQPDNDGLYPVHVAATVGAKHAIELILKNSGGSSAGLRDAKGRTFLHVAVCNGQVGIIGYACGDRSLAWIMNMQDNDGNTALHLAVEAGSLRMFSAMVGNRHVNINLANAERETPLDIARCKISPGLFYDLKSQEEMIFRTLFRIGAAWGTYRRGH
ncbi:hypothetical protein BS78_05G035800 [Paspalum vaginatum]|nr:hypothetical protein BS78_05G035800 [Paspalum vaginatum]